MSRRRVTDPKEIVSVGQEVRVKVIKVDNDGKRISLSMKDQEPDPWSDVADRYPAGSQFTGKIVRSTDFGYFVEVEPGLDGLVHLSQLPLGVKPGDESVAIGSSVTGWIREVDPSKKRLSLSLREVATPIRGKTRRRSTAPARSSKAPSITRQRRGSSFSSSPASPGLIPISEINVPPGSDPSKAFTPGDKVTVRVMSIDSNRKRISLSADAARVAADREEYAKIMDERGEASEGESAMALAFKRAMEEKKSPQWRTERPIR